MKVVHYIYMEIVPTIFVGSISFTERVRLCSTLLAAFFLSETRTLFHLSYYVSLNLRYAYLARRTVPKAAPAIMILGPIVTFAIPMTGLMIPTGY